MKNNSNSVYRLAKNQVSRILLLITLGFFLMSLTPVRASEVDPGQQTTLTGKVTDSFTGKPMTGVTVTVKGTKTVVKTDKNGAYTMVLPKNAKIIVFTLLGYEPLEVAINGKTTIVVEMTTVEIDPTLW
jgi:hypothetical protein